MKKNLNICFVTEEFYPSFVGGQGIYGFNLVSNLAKLNQKITVLAEYRPKRAEYWKKIKNVEVFLTPFCFKNALILAFLEYLLFIFKLKNKHFDILHANQLSGLLFVLFKPKNVNKVVVSIHHTNLEMQKTTGSFIKRFLYNVLIFLEKITFSHADALLFNSPVEEQEVKKDYNLQNIQSSSIYLGVDLPKFNKKEKQVARVSIRQKLNLGKNAKIVLYVGRLVKKKKVNNLLSALSKLNNNSIFGLIIGSGAEEKYLKSISSNNTFFLGFVPDTKNYFLASDLFVTTSVAEGGFLLTALEAASFGLPLILSPSPAGFPIIREGENGYIVSPGNPKLLTEKIESVLKSSDKMGDLSQKIVKRFTWQICAKNTIKYYHVL